MGREYIDETYIHHLCGQTGLTEFLEKLRNGYETSLDPAGKRLALSVVQKILLVRALANKPQLLILENPLAGIERPYRDNIMQILFDTIKFVLSGKRPG